MTRFSLSSIVAFGASGDLYLGSTLIDLITTDHFSAIIVKIASSVVTSRMFVPILNTGSSSFVFIVTTLPVITNAADGIICPLEVLTAVSIVHNDMPVGIIIFPVTVSIRAPDGRSDLSIATRRRATTVASF